MRPSLFVIVVVGGVCWINEESWILFPHDDVDGKCVVFSALSRLDDVFNEDNDGDVVTIKSNNWPLKKN